MRTSNVFNAIHAIHLLYEFDTQTGHTTLYWSAMQVAAAVACSVTVPASSNYWVARNGEDSIFALLGTVVPEVF